MQETENPAHKNNRNNMEEMMKTFKMILFTLMMASLMIGSIALAQPPIGTPGGERPGSTMDEETGAGSEKPMRPEPRGPLGQLMKFQHQNITVAVLAELTGLDADSIDAKLELSHPSEILSTYDIEIETFIAAMDAQTTALVEAAVAAGTITADQEDEIITMIKNKPERPEPEEVQGEEGEIPPRFEYTE
jgi:hypothetical protein